MKKIKGIKKFWLLAIAVIYILFPIDFIPDWITGPAGFFDDLLVLIISILQLLSQYRQGVQLPVEGTTKSNKKFEDKDVYDMDSPPEVV